MAALAVIGAMKNLLLLSVIALNGCGVIECIDNKFERDPKPINETVTVSLTFQEKELSMEVKCEEYYDAMCAERGNYWAVREAGFENDGQTSSFRFTDPELGNVEVSIPRCGDMLKGRDIPLEYILPEINGDTYWLVGMENGIGIYRTSEYLTKIVKEAHIHLTMSINDVALK